MSNEFLVSLPEQTESLKSQGLYKRERVIAGKQQATIDVRNNDDTQEVLNIDPIITHRFPVNEFQKAFDLMESGQSGKIVLDWS